MTRFTNPVPLFLDGRGGLLDAGYIFLGDVNTDPEVGANQLAIFWDAAMTIPAPQPLRTLGGVIVNGIAPSFVYFAETDYSMVVRDVDSVLVSSIPSGTASGGVAYQPLDADLTAIAAVGGQTAYGRSLLTMVDAPDLAAEVGIGSAGVLDEATAAQYRANTADLVLTTDQVWLAAVPVALAAVAGAVAVNLNLGINFTLAMTGTPWTLSNPTNGKPGQGGTIEITQDATGNRLLTYGANWKFVGGADPVLSTAANSKDILGYKVLADGTVFAWLNKAIA